MATGTERLHTIRQMLADSQRGYQEAAEVADDPQYKALFAERARERGQLMQEFGLNAGLASIDNTGTLSGAAHRAFLNLRALVQDDTHAAAAEVERGESAFVEALEAALNDHDLASTDRMWVSRLYDHVRADRDRFAAMHRSDMAHGGMR